MRKNWHSLSVQQSHIGLRIKVSEFHKVVITKKELDHEIAMHALFF